MPTERGHAISLVSGSSYKDLPHDKMTRLYRAVSRGRRRRAARPGHGTTAVCGMSSQPLQPGPSRHVSGEGLECWKSQQSLMRLCNGLIYSWHRRPIGVLYDCLI